MITMQQRNSKHHNSTEFTEQKQAIARTQNKTSKAQDTPEVEEQHSKY
jgi:hypothetical protein